MKIILATSIRARLTGLLKKGRCTNGEVLLLAPCKSIHTFGMRSDLDLAFIDAEARVLTSERNLPPNKLRSHPKAAAALERRSNPTQTWLLPGEQLNLVDKGTGRLTTLTRRRDFVDKGTGRLTTIDKGTERFCPQEKEGNT
ncbi:MAG: DUF192 domain-containing protein [Coriobacteriia bacterium]|nr:DUF192 domain-containing protein [Coriobacteriia bacterium]